MDAQSYAAFFEDATRLYAIGGDGPLSQLQVERWSGGEALSSCYAWVIDALSTDANLSLDDMLGQRASLRITLADGSRSVRSGLICEAQAQGSDGGLSRYRMVLVPWLWVLSQGVHSRIFQDQSVLDIAASVFGEYRDYASWQITPDARSLIANVRPRSYVVQYRETDLAFIERLFAEEGLGYTFVEDVDAPTGHTLVIFGDSGQLPEDPCSVSSGLRYHSASSIETTDTLQALGPAFQIAPDAVTLLSYDYQSNSAISASAAVHDGQGQREIYDPVGMYAFAEAREAGHYAQLAAQAHETRQQYWQGKGTVRSARVGTRFRATDTPWDGQDDFPNGFIWTQLWHAGINNLPAAVQQTVHRYLGNPDAVRSPNSQGIVHLVDAVLWQQAKQTGYAQRFDAVASDRPWRPVLNDEHGLRLNPRPTAPGVQTAIVVGPEGETSPAASGPLHTDGMGRIKVKFHWMEGGATCWLRVTQRYAGGGHGMQALPRIGQEVLVNFMGGDIDRPIVVGALYNGQGEAGVAPSPGAAAVAAATELYTQAADFQSSAQGNLAGGNSPAWHGLGANPESHANAAALSGLKTQGFDGEGYNQFVMDDTDQQGRVQFATTQAATQLNLGHLVHQADNYRGSFRGRGMELRTDSYGAVRGTSGVLISTYALSHSEPAADVTAASALLKQQSQLSKVLSQAATAHAAVPLATHEGVLESNASELNDQAAPIDAIQQSLSSTVISDNFDNAEPGKGAGDGSDVPHSADALVTLAGRGGIGALAGHSLHMAANETVALGSGQDTNLVVANQLRIHSNQAIGWLAGAQQANDVGFSLIAGKGELNVQAQHEALALRSKGDLTLVSVNAAVEMAAKQTVHLAVSGGAHMTIEGGRIVFGCPGKIMAYAANHQLEGATQLNLALLKFPDNRLQFQDDYPMSL